MWWCAQEEAVVADTDISPVVARIVDRIRTVADVGQVHAFDIYNADDLVPMIVSRIAGENVMRAWWITGPSMNGRPMVQSTAQHIERTWTYQIHGIVGIEPDGSHITTLRTLALAISDAIDADRELNGTVHRAEPCRWVIAPENRTVVAGVGVGYVQIHKPVVTLSTP